jgi:hypothetical protein
MDSDEGYDLTDSLNSLGWSCHVSLSAVSLPKSFGNSVCAAGERLLTRLLLPPSSTKRRLSLNNGRLRNLYISVNIEALTELCSRDMTVSSFNPLWYSHSREVWESIRDRKIQPLQEGKGRTILLGDYGPSEIREPPTNDKADLQHRVDWGKTVWNIKASFRGFLKKILGWVESWWHVGLT